MGRLIDCNDVYNALQITTDNFGVAKSVVENSMLTMLFKIETAEAIPKAEYEARLKADMVAMLTEIQLEIEEQKRDELSYQHIWNHPLNVCISIIQQKIDELREGVKEKPKSCSTCRSYKGHAGHCEICHEMSMYKEKENG